MSLSKEFGRNSSFCGVLKKVMESVTDPMSCDEITTHVIELWGRGLPVNPYGDICLVYKFLKTYMETEENLDDLNGEIIMVESIGGRTVPLSPNLLPSELQSVEDQIKRIKFKLKK